MAEEGCAQCVSCLILCQLVDCYLPSSKRAHRETQAHRNPLALTGAVFNHLSQGPGPRSTVNKHSIEIISSLFCSLIFVLSLHCLSLFPSLPCLFISHVLQPLASSLDMLLPTFALLSLFLLTPHPLGFLGLCSWGFLVLSFKPLCLFLPPRTWQQRGNLLSCSLFVPVSPPTWHAVKFLVGCQDEHQIHQDHRRIIYFSLNLVQRIF